jgi:hypothetical protein
MRKPTLLTFPASAAERITGLSTETQRVWRRRGYLPAIKGHARFNVFDLAAIKFMAMLSEIGIGPERSAAIAALGGDALASHALFAADAYEGLSDEDISPDFHWKICAAFGKNPRRERYFVVWGDKSACFTSDLSRSFAGEPGELITSLQERSAFNQANISESELAVVLTSGPVLVFDLVTIGFNLSAFSEFVRLEPETAHE